MSAVLLATDIFGPLNLQGGGLPLLGANEGLENASGLGLMSKIAVHFTGLKAAGTSVLTVTIQWDNVNSGTMQNVMPQEVFTTLVPTGGIWVMPYDMYVPSGGRMGASVKSDGAGAGNDDAVSGTINLLGTSIVDVMSVGHATPESFDDVPSSPAAGSRDELLIRGGPTGRRLS